MDPGNSYELDYDVTDMEIKYKNQTLKDYRNNKIKGGAIETGKQVKQWAPIAWKIIKDRGPKLLDKGSLFMYFFNAQELGKSSSLKYQEEQRREQLKSEVATELDTYMENVYKNNEKKNELEKEIQYNED